MVIPPTEAGNKFNSKGMAFDNSQKIEKYTASDFKKAWSWLKKIY